MKRTNITMIVLAIMAVCMLAASPAFASYSYDFTVDTSSSLNQTGYIDLQFNPGISSAGTANVSIANYISDGALVGSPVTQGGAAGTLPGTVTITNSTQMNDYFHQMTFGNSIHVSLTLDSVPGNTFALSFYGADGATPLLTNDTTNGFATTIDVNANGAVITNNSDQVTVAATPIPAAAWLFGSGLMGLAGVRRKMQKNG